jgi:hypothetical protein
MFSTWPQELNAFVARNLDCEHVMKFALISTQCSKIIRDEKSGIWEMIYFNTFSNKKDERIPDFLLPYYQHVFEPPKVSNWKQSCKERIKYENAMEKVDPRNSVLISKRRITEKEEDKENPTQKLFPYHYALSPGIPFRGEIYWVYMTLTSPHLFNRS